MRKIGLSFLNIKKYTLDLIKNNLATSLKNYILEINSNWNIKPQYLFYYHYKEQDRNIII